MPPRALRASRSVTAVLPEAAQVAFLVDAAHLMTVKAPAMAAYLGRRALVVCRVAIQKYSFTVHETPLHPPETSLLPACKVKDSHGAFSRDRGAATVQQPANPPEDGLRSQVSQVKKVPLPKGAAQKLCQRCGTVLQLTEPDRRALHSVVFTESPPCGTTALWSSV